MIRLQQLRLDQHLTLDELGARAKVSPEQVRRIEQGKAKNPRVETLSALAAALNARPSELLMDALPPRPEPEDVAA